MSTNDLDIKAPSVRLTNIDMLRGIVMILMCIDHARDYTLFHPADPMVLTETPWLVFLLRILAHMCAPTFIFLAGISIWLSRWKKDKRQLSRHLLSRDYWIYLIKLLHRIWLSPWHHPVTTNVGLLVLEVKPQHGCNEWRYVVTIAIIR